eukprot:TRINITY_DN76699_c0_g1_i1.p1 TRINITY_DN76699_c0_g1~~TRINITY_DN76699_c0_g1_i1.p1  ORF type:complete len:128 (-),score=15.20 TRINITY_DN76699_c0_g1_i1:22-405(-)
MYTFPLNSDNLIHENLPENASITISIKYLDEIKVEAKANWTGENEKDQKVISSLAERLARCNAVFFQSFPNHEIPRNKHLTKYFKTKPFPLSDTCVKIIYSWLAYREIIEHYHSIPMLISVLLFQKN